MAQESQIPKKVHGTVEGVDYYYKLDANGNKGTSKTPSEHGWVRHMLRRKRGPVVVEWDGPKCRHVKNDPSDVKRMTETFIPAEVDRLGNPIIEE